MTSGGVVNTVTGPLVVQLEAQVGPTRIRVSDGESQFEAVVMDGSLPLHVRYGDWLRVEDTLIQSLDEHYELTGVHEIRQVRLFRHAEGPLRPEEV